MLFIRCLAFYHHAGLCTTLAAVKAEERGCVGCEAQYGSVLKSLWLYLDGPRGGRWSRRPDTH